MSNCLQVLLVNSRGHACRAAATWCARAAAPGFWAVCESSTTRTVEASMVNSDKILHAQQFGFYLCYIEGDCHCSRIFSAKKCQRNYLWMFNHTRDILNINEM